ncbi:hypothetical protein AV530_001179 [Patagioenas fasciata monilis]|uniref:Uncharacterized protein n=1 Tax=Patagioenas fasciata monilis TaxID=372326 RepID=A0A1V4KTJ1_PATFA|nr:hypothetical protein AV530_001179 [Patagioenas fasciata monilis]
MRRRKARDGARRAPREGGFTRAKRRADRRCGAILLVFRVNIFLDLKDQITVFYSQKLSAVCNKHTTIQVRCLRQVPSLSRLHHLLMRKQQESM